MEDVELTFESVDEILWCDHLNKTSLPVLINGTICLSIFYKMKLRTFLMQPDFSVQRVAG